MKIVSWNIQQGGGRRIPNILGVISEHDADTVVLSEVTPDRAGELRAGLEALGYSHCHLPAIPPRDRGVLLASREACELRAGRETSGLPHHRWAEVWFPAPAFSVVCTYFPAIPDAIRAFWPLVHRACSDLRHRPVLIVGDLNSGETACDAQGTPLSGDPWFTAMPLHGFTDLWRLAHGDRREYSWFSQRGGRDLNGFRLDHAFGSATLHGRVRTCCYSHGERTARVSDHSALVLTVA